MPHVLEVIDNHSVAVDLLTKGPVLDAGARGFVFSNWFAKRGHEVFAIDPSPDVENLFPKEWNPIRLIKAALVGPGYPKMMSLQLGPDPNAWYVKYDGSFESVPIDTVQLSEIGPRGCQWDVIKLNIEGSEYDILDNWPGPIARQIVFSFHEHTDRKRGREECDRIIDKLRQWYDISNQVWEPRYCTYANYWDILAIEKGLS